MGRKSKVLRAINALKFSKVEYKPLCEGVQPPMRADSYSIGYDLIVPETIQIPAHSRFYVPMGFSIGLPKYIEGKIESRSGFAGKGMEGLGTKWSRGKLWGFIPIFHKDEGLLRFDCDVLTGKIDPGYHGEVNVIVSNHDVSFAIPKGTKLAQMTFYRTMGADIELVKELHGYDRGGGLGHTGTRV